jgi:anti-sigma B factor antagonist
MIVAACVMKHLAVVTRHVFLSGFYENAPGVVMNLSLRSDEGEVCRLQVEGEIRVGDRPCDSHFIDALLGPDCYMRKILLDLRHTPYMDSSGVSWLVSLHKQCREAGGILVVHSIPPTILAILKLLHMDRYLNLVEDDQAAQVMATRGNP